MASLDILASQPWRDKPVPRNRMFRYRNERHARTWPALANPD
jgi:hypothetical protein